MTGIYFNDVFLMHETGFGHPEKPDRLRAIMAALSEKPISNTCKMQISSPASKQAITAVHQKDYVEFVMSHCQDALQHLDADTVVSAKSCEAALYAAGATMSAIDAVMQGEIDNAFCIVRPPGHHAEIDKAMGFCLFNNIAIAAQHLKTHYNLEKVFILDWDVHHGNGTQQAFYDDPEVFFLSLHQWPLYPGTGSPHESGAGEGISYTRNVTFSPHTPAEGYLRTFNTVVESIFSQFRPEFVLISAGFDAHVDDPLAQLMLAENDYEAMTRFVLERAALHSGSRVVSLLEGGYNLHALANSVHAHISVLAEKK